MVHPTPTFEDYFQQGQQALAAGKADQAYLNWHHCIPLLPDKSGAHRQLAHAFKSIGQLTNAEALIKDALKENPNDSLLNSDIANVLLDKNSRS